MGLIGNDEPAGPAADRMTFGDREPPSTGSRRTRRSGTRINRNKQEDHELGLPRGSRGVDGLRPHRRDLRDGIPDCGSRITGEWTWRLAHDNESMSSK